MLPELDQPLIHHRIGNLKETRDVGAVNIIARRPILLGGAMANPSRGDKPHAEWATRLIFAHDNAVENLVIFAPLVLILNAIDYSTKWTVLACAVYFWARVAHLIVYTLGLPVFRTLAFTVGFLAQVVLALAIFGVR